MVGPFEVAARQIAELGFFNFVVPFLITGAVFYGLLRKAGVFSTAVDAVISLSVSFFIWGYLVTTAGAELGAPLSKFITQVSVIIIMFLFVLLGAALFYPDLNEVLKRLMPSGQWIWIFLGVFIVFFFITSGLGNVLGFGQIFAGSPAGVIVLILLFLFLGVLIASLIGGEYPGGG